MSTAGHSPPQTWHIKYETKTLEWVQRNDSGDIYCRPFNSKEPGIESFEVELPKNDYVRELLHDEIISRKDLFLKALQSDEVKHLPRLTFMI